MKDFYSLKIKNKIKVFPILENYTILIFSFHNFNIMYK